MSRVRHGPASENLHRRRHSEEDRRAEPGRCAKRRLNQRYFGRAILSLGLGAIAFAPIDLGGFQANHCIGVRRSVVRDASISGCMYLARRSPYPRRRTMKPMLGVTLGRWTTKRKLLATGLFCLSLATPGVASAASSGVPTVDIAITCRTSEKALIAIFGASYQQTFESCMTSEKAAREQIVKDWQKFRPEAANAARLRRDTCQATSSGSRTLRWNSRSMSCANKPMSRSKKQRPTL
jgi:hypothetical protein